MAYANGRRALGQCDRCGQRYLLKELHNEWNGFKTCSECWEPKQPQLRTTKINAFNSLVVDPIGTALTFSSINGSVGTVTVVTTWH